MIDSIIILVCFCAGFLGRIWADSMADRHEYQKKMRYYTFEMKQLLRRVKQEIEDLK